VTAPVGDLVRIFYDSRERVAPGDAIVTPTGRTYEVVSVRLHARGKHAGRQHLGCIVTREPAPDARVFTLRWYPRARRAHRPEA